MRLTSFLKTLTVLRIAGHVFGGMSLIFFFFLSFSRGYTRFVGLGRKDHSGKPFFVEQRYVVPVQNMIYTFINLDYLSEVVLIF